MLKIVEIALIDPAQLCKLVLCDSKGSPCFYKDFSKG